MNVLLAFEQLVRLWGNISGLKVVALLSGGLILYLRSFGVDNRGSGAEQPVSQYDVTVPLPLSSTSPLNSSSNIPNLSRISFVASDT